jgi:hypothetical protein
MIPTVVVPRLRRPAFVTSFNGLATVTACAWPGVTEGGGQVTIRVPAAASGARFYSPALATGAVTIMPAALASGVVAYAPRVIAAGPAIIPPVLLPTVTAFVPSIQPGAATVLPVLLGSGSALFPASVQAPVAGAVAPALLASSAAVLAPAVQPGSVAVQPLLLASAAAFYAPVLQMVTAGTIQPILLPSTAAAFAPTIAAGAVTVSPPVLTSGVQQYAPTIQPGAAAVAPAALASTASFYAPAVLPGVATVAAPALPSAAAIYPPSVQPGAARIAPALLASTGIASAPVVTVAAAIPTLNITSLQTKLSAGQRARWGLVGDSVTAGYGSKDMVGTANGNGPEQAGNYLRQNSWPSQYAALLTAAGIPARADSFFSGAMGGTNIAQLAAAYPGMSFGAGWSVAGINTIGGLFITCSGTGSMVFTPQVAANSFDIYITGYDGLGTFAVTDASGTLATISESEVTGLVMGGSAYRKVTVTRAVASSAPISIQRTGVGGDIYIDGIVPFDTTSPRLELINLGWPGSSTNEWVTTSDNSAWAPRYALGTLLFDHWSIELAANDANNGVSVSTFQANLTTLVGLLSGTKRLIKTNKATGGGFQVPASFLTAIDSVSTANNLPAPIDFNGGITLANPGDYFDSIHLVKSGYAKKAARAYAETVNA